MALIRNPSTTLNLPVLQLPPAPDDGPHLVVEVHEQGERDEPLGEELEHVLVPEDVLPLEAHLRRVDGALGHVYLQGEWEGFTVDLSCTLYIL